jgi:hypothetical protein
MERQAVGSDETYRNICDHVCALDRDELAYDLLNFPGDLTLDFTEDYLAACTTEQMQHMLAAALWRSFVKQLSTGVAAHA